MSTPTLEEVSAARETARLRVEAAVELIAALEPGWRAAGAEHSAALEELARIDLALKSAKRAHLVAAAVDALGIETGEPPLVVVPGHGLPKVYELVALNAGGVGLYLHRATYRRRTTGKDHALRIVHVPRAVLDVLAELNTNRNRSKDEVEPLRARLEELTAPGARYEVNPVHGSDELMYWQARGRGDFGNDGARKPLPPPGGGRWRWLKVAEQAELATEN